MNNLNILLATILFLTANGFANANTPRSEVIKSLLDPESARFGQEFQVGNYACVEVNSKNIFGGYSGRKTVFLTKYKRSLWEWVEEFYSFEQCKYRAKKAFGDEANEIKYLSEEQQYEKKLEVEQKKNPTRKPIHRDRIAQTWYWFTANTPKNNAEGNIICAGWISATIKQDIVYQFGLETRFSHDRIYEIYTENHPMMPYLNKLMKQGGREKFESYIEQNIKPQLIALGDNIEKEVGSKNTQLGAKYILQILNNKAAEECRAISNDFRFVFFNKDRARSNPEKPDSPSLLPAKAEGDVVSR